MALFSFQIASRPLRPRPPTFSYRTIPFRTARPNIVLSSRTLTSKSQAPKESQETNSKPPAISEHDSDSASSPSTDASKMAKPPPDWEDNPNYNVERFADLPQGAAFGFHQHMQINVEFREALTQVLRQFEAPIRYAFAYGSGVFPQSKPVAGASGTTSSKTSIHANPPAAIEKAQGGNPKMIDFIFGVSYSQHWHSLNLRQHRNHYSALGSLGSGAVTAVQEKWGAGVYFNPYVTVNGTLIKYGVVNLDTLCTDLSEWNTLYLAGRLQKPVKILRDDPRVRLANQVNLVSALRTALLLLPPKFTEEELYGMIASISYMGDPRMALPTENKSKVANIVGNNLPHFRRLYFPLMDNLPNVNFVDARCSDPKWTDDPTLNVALEQDMDPIRRGNMVRRLPKAFRSKLYFQFQKKFQIPRLEFNKIMEASSDEDSSRFYRRDGGGFERRIAEEPPECLRGEVRGVIKNTIGWPSTSQSMKGLVTSGFGRSWTYMMEKITKYRQGNKEKKEQAKEAKKED